MKVKRLGAVDSFLFQTLAAPLQHPRQITAVRFGTILLTAIFLNVAMDIQSLRAEHLLSILLCAVIWYIYSFTKLSQSTQKLVAWGGATLVLPIALALNYTLSAYSPVKLVLMVAGVNMLFAILDWRLAVVSAAIGSYLGWLLALNISGMPYGPMPSGMPLAISVSSAASCFMAIVVAEDVRSRRNLANAYVSVLAHELRTPISALSHLAHRLKKDFPAQTSTHTTAIQIEKIVGAMQSHIDLQVHNTHQRPYAFNYVQADLETLIRQAVDRQFIGRPEIKDVIMISVEDRISVYVHEDIFCSVIQNLLSNAVKAVDRMKQGDNLENGDIVITLRLEDDQAIVDIIDKGIGIAREDQTKIFDAFYSSSGEHQQPANGLGLTMVKKSIEQMGGTVSVKSEWKQGSVFELRLRGIKS